MFVLYTLPEAQRTQGIKSITFLWLKSVWYNLKVNDTFGKWCRCLTNVCYLKLKKHRYLDKCRLSASAKTSAQGWSRELLIVLGQVLMGIPNLISNTLPVTNSFSGVALLKARFNFNQIWTPKFRSCTMCYRFRAATIRGQQIEYSV